MAGSKHDSGLALRKKVVGAEQVERMLAEADRYSRPLQETVNEFCWGMVWDRPGLDLRSRSMITVAMLTALNRSNELKTHLRGALRNGVTREEISEILLHAMVYCGAPASVEAFRCMKEVFAAADAA